jgi:hypothetical protein
LAKEEGTMPKDTSKQPYAKPELKASGNLLQISFGEGEEAAVRPRPKVKVTNVQIIYAAANKKLTETDDIE